ncbi:MAG: ribosome maturation factor RimP [Nitrospirae bacterium]|nr:MAG: ribosome maturation factor RimP [Nitrospirota bacterium]
MLFVADRSRPVSAPVASQVEALVRPVVEALGLVLWDVEYRGGGGRGLLRITVDREGAGVTLDDCQRVSQEVSTLLDVEDPIHHPYDLEVSSPGVERPLRHAWHFRAAAGERVEVHLYAPVAGRKRWVGTLATEDGDHLTLATEAGRVALTRDQVSRAHLVPDYDALMGALSRRKDG